MWFVNCQKLTNHVYFINRIRLKLRPTKTDRNLINLVLWLAEKLFVRHFLVIKQL